MSGHYHRSLGQHFFSDNIFCSLFYCRHFKLGFKWVLKSLVPTGNCFIEPDIYFFSESKEIGRLNARYNVTRISFDINHQNKKLGMCPID